MKNTKRIFRVSVALIALLFISANLMASPPIQQLPQEMIEQKMRLYECELNAIIDTIAHGKNSRILRNELEKQANALHFTDPNHHKLHKLATEIKRRKIKE